MTNEKRNLFKKIFFFFSYSSYPEMSLSGELSSFIFFRVSETPLNLGVCISYSFLISIEKFALGCEVIVQNGQP